MEKFVTGEQQQTTTTTTIPFCRLLERVTSVDTYSTVCSVNSCFSCVFKLTDELNEYKTIAEKTCEVNKCIVLLSYIYCELSKMAPFLRIEKKNDKNGSGKINCHLVSSVGRALVC